MDGSISAFACLPGWRPQFGMLPLHFAAENQAGPEVVAALLKAHPDAATNTDRVSCRTDVVCCLFSDCMCAAMWSRNVWVGGLCQFVDLCSTATFVQTDCVYSPKR